MKISAGFFVGVSLMLLMFSPTAWSDVLPFLLGDMVSNSELIFIGKVTRIEKTTNQNKSIGVEHKATIQIEKMIKGSGELKEVDAFYWPDISTDPNLAVGERAIFFIKTWEGKYTLVQGYAGEVKIDNDVVNTMFIKDEPDAQPMGVFLDKIKKLIR
jgi:hypothetical protein